MSHASKPGTGLHLGKAAAHARKKDNATLTYFLPEFGN